MSAKETSFTALAGVPVNYDRLPPPHNYGTTGQPRTFFCTNKLKATLDRCLSDLFQVWGRNEPSLILSAGTTGDGGGEHGRGLAFDLDGFYWDHDNFMMLEYPSNRPFYLGINAHLFLYFSQVLSYHYPNHSDHFHADFNFSYRYRTSSNAQTFFLQACLAYLFDKNLGKTGIEKDGVDGLFGSNTKQALLEVLEELELDDALTTTAGWKAFLEICRKRGFR
jgi:hypothetical protein